MEQLEPLHQAEERNARRVDRRQGLHALVRAGELGVTELAAAVGMKPQAVSNQLQRLSDLGILDSRRDGTSIRYRVVDHCVTGLLEQGWCLTESDPMARG